MTVYPAIDLRGGRCVRLVEGDFARETVYGDDPVAMAKRWEDAGARWLHVVDLDGARAGAPVQAGVIARICRAVGMQLLFEESEESPGVRGLGVFGGRVVRFPRRPDLKVPHMGWNRLRIRKRVPALAEVADGDFVYFVHSFHPEPADPGVIATTTDYGGEFVSSVGRDNVYAGVFHPEKSQHVGLKLLRGFVKMLGGAR